MIQFREKSGRTEGWNTQMLTIVGPKGIIEKFASLSLCIKYNRIEEIQKIITSNEINRYNQIGVVCPPTIHENIFTTAAIDNIDHNAASSTATNHFHCTSISISDRCCMSTYNP